MRIIVTALVILGALVFAAQGRDNGKWATDSDISRWFRNLKMPDQPAMSCCGEADAYWADSYLVNRDGDYIAIITDEREVEGRVPREPGTQIVIPKWKLKYDQGNPTGHGIVFLSPGTDEVYCYLAPGGV